MIEEIYFADPDHDSIFVNENDEEVCPKCEKASDECTCHNGYDDDPDLPETEET